MAPEQLLPLVYQSLKDLARQRMALENPGHTLQATALVHEAYLRLARAKNVRWMGQAQFYHAAAGAMRRILVEHARARGAVKRGGGARRVPVDILDLAEEADREEILALDEAIRRLEEHTPEIAAVVRLRFYAGLTVGQTAEALAMGRRSVDRAWAYARVWLFRELYGDPSTSSGQAPSTSSGQAPSTNSGQAPSANSGQAPSTSSGQAPGAPGAEGVDGADGTGGTVGGK